MATLTLSNSFGNDWPPNALGGGVIVSRTATTMTYTSDLGYTVTLRGTGFTYDADGMPSGGTVTRTTIALGGQTFADFTGVSVDFGRAGMLIFGFDRDNGNHQNPDPFAFQQIMLRGNDLVNGSNGNDDIHAGTGNDTINTGAGGDYIDGEAGNDVMNGGADWDTLSFDEANYRWESFRGVNLDALTGVALDPFGFTDSFTNFERYKDTLYADTLRGANVDEEFVINRGNDLVDGRGGFDRVDYSEADNWGAHRGITVNLATGIVVDSWKGTDTLINIESVIGTIFNDRMTGNAGHNEFLSGPGIDTIDGAGGTDRIAFWHDEEGFVSHGIVVNLNLATEVVDDGFGNAENANNIEDVYGSNSNDRIIGNGIINDLFGEGGNDTISGGGGEDFLRGGWGNDRIFGGGGNNDHIDGGGDNDTLTGNAGNDNFNFGWDLADAGVDTVTDFDGSIDLIHIASWWGGGFVNDTLVAGQFRSGAGVTTANSASQRVIYNTTTGDLYFDADGNGDGFAAVRFATLSNHATLTFDDIHVML